MNEVTKVCRMIQRYNEYKDSGVQWLGEIPSHWACMSLLYALRSKICDGPHETPNYIDTGIPFISIDSLNDSDHIDFTNVRRFISEEDYQRYCQKTVIEKNDILFSKAATIGKTAIVGDEKFMVWSPLAVLKPSSKFIITRYLYHLLCNKKVIDDVSLSGSESTQINVGMRELEKLRIPVPTLPEQQAIATYLDEATSKIDDAIAQQQKMIDLLNERKQIIINNAVTKGLNPNVKMKDSGVDWIGEIPEGWEFCKLKHLTSIISKGTTPSTIGRDILETGEIRFLKAENIVDNKVQFSPEFYIDDITHGMMKRSNLQEDDILFVIAGATIGKVAIMPKEFIPANTNQAISFIRLIDKSYAPYIWNVLQSDITKKYIWQNAVQSAQPNISMENLGNMQIPLPSKAEQIDILHYIEKCIKPIEDARFNAEKQISLLQERKQIIINDVVTGKVKVK